MKISPIRVKPEEEEMGEGILLHGEGICTNLRHIAGEPYIVIGDRLEGW